MNSERSGAVCVLGAAGFIGSHVVAELERRRIPVIAPDLDLDHTAPPSASACIHLAEPSVLRDPAAAERNIPRLRRILGVPFERIVYVSSAVVYGDRSPHPRREDEAIAPTGAYATAKASAEHLCAHDARCVVARLANAYGRGMSPHSVLSDIVRQLGTAGPIELRDLEPVRDYIHVSDAARALVDLAASTATGIFNIGTARGTAVRELARIACEAAGTPDREIHATDPRGASSVLVLDVERMRRELGWSPSVAVEQGVAALVRDQVP